MDGLINVSAPSATRNDGMLSGENQMVEVLARAASERCYTSIPADELLGHKVDPDVQARIDAGSIAKERAAMFRRPLYELTEKRYEPGVDIVGKMSYGQFVDAVGAFFHDLKQKLDETRGGDWRLVAWRIYDRDTEFATREKRDPNDPALRIWSATTEGPDPGGGYTKPAEHVGRKVTQRTIVLHGAFADITQTPPRDIWRERTGKPDGAMNQYAEKNELRFLPARALRDRKGAEELIRVYYEALGRSQREPEPAPVLERLDRNLEPGQVVACHLLEQQGQTWAEIGRVFGVPWQRVKALVEKHRATLPDESKP